MNKQKVNQAIKDGDLITYNQVFDSYSQKDQQQILSKAKYLQVAMAIRALRKSAKLSQQNLASKMQVKREFISRMESGQQNITLETLYRVADATNKHLQIKFTPD